MRLSKIEVRCASACEAIIKVRKCVRHTAKILATQCLNLFLGCKLPCLVTNDKTYLGQDSIDKFDALIFKIRYFKSDDRGNYDLL